MDLRREYGSTSGRRGGHNGMGPIIRNYGRLIRSQVHAYDRSPSPISLEHEASEDTQYDVSHDHSLSPSSTQVNSNNHDHVEEIVSDEIGYLAMVNSILHPNGLWFHDHEVVKAVVETSYKMYFRGPWCNWSMVPQEAKGIWWNAFKTKYSWDAIVTKDVKEGWETKCKRRLSGMISRMCTKKDYVAPWCAPSIRSNIMQHRGTEEFKKRSQQCSLNKKNLEKEMPLHCQGSKSSVQLKNELEKSLKRKVTPAEVYRKGHINKDEKFVDKTSENVWADFENKKVANLEAEEAKSENDLLLEALGEWKSGRIYGLGSAANMFYARSRNDNEPKRPRNDHVNQLENQVEQLTSENSQLKKELAETKEGLNVANDKLDQTNQSVKILQEQFQSILNGRINASLDVGLSS